MTFDSGESLKDVTLRARSLMMIMLYNLSYPQITSLHVLIVTKNEIKQDIPLSLPLYFSPCYLPQKVETHDDCNSQKCGFVLYWKKVRDKRA